MISMTWHSVCAATTFCGKAALVVGLVGVLIFGQLSETRDPIAKYKKTGRLRGLMKIFSRF